MERSSREVKLVDPDEFNRIVDFNTMKYAAICADYVLHSLAFAWRRSYGRREHKQVPPQAHKRPGGPAPKP